MVVENRPAGLAEVVTGVKSHLEHYLSQYVESAGSDLGLPLVVPEIMIGSRTPQSVRSYPALFLGVDRGQNAGDSNDATVRLRALVVHAERDGERRELAIAAYASSLVNLIDEHHRLIGQEVTTATSGEIEFFDGGSLGEDKVAVAVVIETEVDKEAL
mgnify:CR=1 FL=1